MQKRVNYNYIAPFYDRLCQLVFGQSVKNAQIESLQSVPANSRILIIGGGTGWILEELGKMYPSGLKLTYLDSASKMIELSRKRNVVSNTVEFVHEFIEDANLPFQQYDVVITPFIFSGFTQFTSQHVFQKLHDSLKINGLWLNIDFYISDESRYWQIALLKFMYTSFRRVCRIEAKKLPFLEDYFSSYAIIKRKKSCRDFIDMQVFQKRLSNVNLH